MKQPTTLAEMRELVEAATRTARLRPKTVVILCSDCPFRAVIGTLGEDDERGTLTDKAVEMMAEHLADAHLEKLNPVPKTADPR